MKVLSIRGNKVNFDFTEYEYDMLLRDGLQKWIDGKIGLNKIKVMAPDPTLIVEKTKPLTKKEQKEEDQFVNELLTLSVVAALKAGLEKDKEESSLLCDHANEVPAKCKCDTDCYCKSHTCKPRKK